MKAEIRSLRPHLPSTQRCPRLRTPLLTISLPNYSNLLRGIVGLKLVPHDSFLRRGRKGSRPYEGEFRNSNSEQKSIKPMPAFAAYAAPTRQGCGNLAALSRHFRGTPIYGQNRSEGCAGERMVG